MPLTDKQSRFVEAYLLEPDGTKAAIATGYSAASAAVEANRLLKNAKVVAALAERRRQLEAATGITVERVLEELAKIGFSDIRQVVSWRAHVLLAEDPDGEERLFTVGNDVTLKNSAEISDVAAAGIAEISKTKDGALRVKLHPKLPALVKIGETLGMFRTAQPRKPAAARPADAGDVGKKKAADAAARTAEVGTGWERLVN